VLRIVAFFHHSPCSERRKISGSTTDVVTIPTHYGSNESSEKGSERKQSEFGDNRKMFGNIHLKGNKRKTHIFRFKFKIYEKIAKIVLTTWLNIV